MYQTNGKMREIDALDSNSVRVNEIQHHFGKIMQALGLDLNDASLQDTPGRVARMFVYEIFKGLDSKQYPDIKLFENKYGYDEMLVEKDISLYSYCEHHFVPIIGKVHLAYYPTKHIIGLSKINRLVHYLASKPQVQEKLTVEISEEFQKVLRTEDVAVYIEADHLCVASRGVQDTNSSTITHVFNGRFKNNDIKKQFLSNVR
jgi:GTP cyclohydrolase I